MFLGDRMIETERTGIAVENPVTGRTIAQVPALTRDEVERLAARGRVAQPAWAAAGPGRRTEVLRRAQTWLLDHTDRVLDSVVAETGKAREDALYGELTYTVHALDFWRRNAARYLADQRVRTSSPLVQGKRLAVRYRPLGLVGVIAPWNYPIANGFGDCIPALAAGNAVILKPSEVTPLSSLLIEEMLGECGLPDGVLQVATGAAGTGEAVVDAVDMVMFTGSTSTGRRVAARAGERLIPASLELGGKDPMIVLADADLPRAAQAAVYYSMMNAGQVCLSVERVYVEAPVYERFVALVAERVSALRQGAPGGLGSVDVGAMTRPEQLELVGEHVRDAVANGARVLTGGRARGPFYEPTVLTGAHHGMTCMREETFGPTLPIVRVADADEAVRLANDSRFGLAASVFTADVSRGEAIARRLESGIVSVNDAFSHLVALELPMGGAKDSGLGSRHGPDGIRKYCQRQSVLVARFPLPYEPQFYPYSARRSRFMRRSLSLLYRLRARAGRSPDHDRGAS
jgi:acyl-CoA reductase-like NAD-dependent aldehyde dehydrogenase